MTEQQQTKEYGWQGRQFSQEVVTVTDKGLRKQGISSSRPRPASIRCSPTRARGSAARTRRPGR